MQFLSSEWYSILLYGLGLGSLGMAWRATDLHLQQRSNTSFLDPDPEAIRVVDPHMYSLLVQLQEYKMISRSTFEELNIAVDRLCVIAHKLPTLQERPSQELLTRAHCYFEDARAFLNKFCEKAERKKSVKEEHASVVCYKLRKPIEERLQHIWTLVQTRWDAKNLP